MATSDDGGTAERLAQVRAQRRRLDRLRAAEHRDAAHERTADIDGEREAQDRLDHDPLAAPPISSADTRSLLIAEQAALELDTARLVADRDIDGIEMGL